MDSRAWAYSFLKEESLQCDYEIMTDQLSSDIARVVHDVKHIKELSHLGYLVYHCNGSIRGELAIEKADYDWLSNAYDWYLERVKETKMFVVPQGSIGACGLHQLRAKTKMCVRIAYKIQHEGIEVHQRLLDFLNLLSNTLFLMALYENKCEGYKEQEFVSKSYGC